MTAPEFITGTLENWAIDTSLPMIWGNVYGNSKFRDGDMIHTSWVDKDQLVDLKEGDVITTVFSTYKLGRPLIKMIEEALQQ